MKTSRVRVVVLPIAFLGCSTFAQAHPGHDGHELTWDFSHLMTYPVATFVCFAALASAGWAGGWLLRRSTTMRIQSLRRSHPSRGK